MPMLYLRCKTCNIEFTSGISVDEKSFETMVISNYGISCPKGHAHTYDKEDFYFIPNIFDRDELKKRTFKIHRLNIPYKSIPEKEATVEFKFRAWVGSANLFDGEQKIILDLPIGNNTRIRFDRTRDQFRFIRVRYDKNGIEQLEIPVDGSKERPLSRLHPYHVFLIWSKKGIRFAIGNTGLDNLHQIGE